MNSSLSSDFFISDSLRLLKQIEQVIYYHRNFVEVIFLRKDREGNLLPQFSQLLLALTYIPKLGPNPNRVLPYPQPFASHLRIGGVVLSGMWVLTMFLVPVLVGTLAALLHFSSLGKQIRAAANNPDAARLCGISVGRVSAVTWAMAGALSAIAAVLQAPTQPSFNIASLGPYLLMLALGAAASQGHTRESELGDILGELETEPAIPAEVGVMLLVSAEDQETATAISKLANPLLLHLPLPTMSYLPSFAFATSPAHIDRGAAYEFVLNHVVDVDSPTDMFRLEMEPSHDC